MLIFNRTYFLIFSILLVIETVIALFIPEGFIRHYIGDVLVVILINCFVLSFLKLPVVQTAFGVLQFAFFIEILQYFKLLDILGLSHSRVARVVLGSTFDWMDMVMYTLGITVTLVVEKWRSKAQVKPVV